MNRPRVLVVAEAANPEWVSVPLVGWAHANALRAVADVHLATQIRNADAIRRAGLPDAGFTAIDSERFAAPLWKLATLVRGGAGKGWTMVTALSAFAYYEFERLLWQAFGPRIRAHEFDVVHRITPLTPTVPSPIARRCAAAGVPFVLGPLNGGLPWPKGFDHVRREEREWLSYVRGLHALMPGQGATRRHATAMIIGSMATWAQVATAHPAKCVYVPENGVDPERFAPSDRPRTRGPLEVVFVGRLVPYKGADVVIEAAAPLLRDGRAALTIVGEGPQASRLRAVAAERGVGELVRFEGWLDHDRLRRRLAASDVFAFPSIREFGGGAVIEAMAAGVVPIVVDYGGPGEIVTADTGFALPLGPRDALVAGLRARLVDLARDPARVAEMGRAARARVLRWFTWSAKAAQTREIYGWMLGERDRPDFGMPFPSEVAPGTRIRVGAR